MFARRCAAFVLIWALAAVTVGDAAKSFRDAPPAKRPALAFQRLVRVARKAQSMEELLPLLSAKEARMARFAQQHYDPAEMRKTLAELGSLSAKDIEEMSSRSPYELALDNLKRMAKQVKEYVRTDFDGDTAFVHVKTSTGATMLDAKAKMLREDGDWKFDNLDTDYSKLFDKFK